MSAALSRNLWLFLCLMVAAAGVRVFAQSGAAPIVLNDNQTVVIAPAAAEASAKGDPGEVDQYDPRRDVQADIREALAVARREGKHVLLEAGGRWCIWCGILEIYFEENPDLLAYRKAHFVTVKVATNGKDANARLLRHYGEMRAYPHYFVLDAKGNVLESRETANLEQGRAYDRGRILQFLRENAPARSLAKKRERGAGSAN